MKRTKTLALLAAGAGLVLALAACGANSSAGTGSSGNGSQAAASGPKIGVILPETATSARWQAFDQPMLQSALVKAGLDPIIENAQGDNQKFSQLADSMLSQNVKVLIIAAPNGDVGATVERKAKAQGVPVIDYDRLNLGGSADYYVSFDNVRVGELQGQAMKDAMAGRPPGQQIIEIEGSPTDNNATLFYNGQENILKPLYDSGALKLVNSQRIDGWDNGKGGTTFEQLLSANGGKVDGVVAANDGLAGAIITVLQKNGLAGKVPVTGQDASAAGLKAILQGTQYSTVFKPIQQEADATAQLAADLVKGDTAAADSVAKDSSTDPQGNRTVKSVLLTPQSITKDNVKIVVDQGYVKASEICDGDTAAVCTQLNIH
jgi:D-xylose transport system substrate-binding protein